MIESAPTKGILVEDDSDKLGVGDRFIVRGHGGYIINPDGSGGCWQTEWMVLDRAYCYAVIWTSLRDPRRPVVNGRQLTPEERARWICKRLNEGKRTFATLSERAKEYERQRCGRCGAFVSEDGMGAHLKRCSALTLRARAEIRRASALVRREGQRHPAGWVAEMAQRYGVSRATIHRVAAGSRRADP